MAHSHINLYSIFNKKLYMTTFHSIILDCPHCSTLMNDYELMSYTVHNSISWSDGKCDSGAPDNHQIKICAVCHLPFWKADAALPDDPDWDTEGLYGPLNIHDLPWRFDDNRQEMQIKFYNDLIEDSFADEDDKEIYLRTRLWWSINDIIRSLPNWTNARNWGQLSEIKNHRHKSLKLFGKYKTLLDKNLNRLMFLCIKKGDVDLIHLAEMYREKGDFGKAIEILLQFEGKRGKAYRKMKRKIRQKSIKVFQFVSFSKIVSNLLLLM